MSQGNHHIGRQIFEIEVDSKEGARFVHENVSLLSHTRLQEAMNAALDSLAPNGDTWYFEKIELDIGRLSKTDFSTQTVRRITEELVDALKTALTGERPSAETLLEALEHFLLKGRLPWWKNGKQATTPDQLLLQLIRHSPVELRRMLQRMIVVGRVADRIRLQIGKEALAALSQLAAKGMPDEVQIADDLKQWFRKYQLPEQPKTLDPQTEIDFLLVYAGLTRTAARADHNYLLALFVQHFSVLLQSTEAIVVGALLNNLKKEPTQNTEKNRLAKAIRAMAGTRDIPGLKTGQSVRSTEVDSPSTLPGSIQPLNALLFFLERGYLPAGMNNRSLAKLAEDFHHLEDRLFHPWLGRFSAASRDTVAVKRLISQFNADFHQKLLERLTGEDWSRFFALAGRLETHFSNSPHAGEGSFEPTDLIRTQLQRLYLEKPHPDLARRQILRGVADRLQAPESRLDLQAKIQLKQIVQEETEERRSTGVPPPPLPPPVEPIKPTDAASVLCFFLERGYLPANSSFLTLEALQNAWMDLSESTGAPEWIARLSGLLEKPGALDRLLSQFNLVFQQQILEWLTGRRDWGPLFALLAGIEAGLKNAAPANFPDFPRLELARIFQEKPVPETAKNQVLAALSDWLQATDPAIGPFFQSILGGTVSDETRGKPTPHEEPAKSPPTPEILIQFFDEWLETGRLHLLEGLDSVAAFEQSVQTRVSQGEEIFIREILHKVRPSPEIETILRPFSEGFIRLLAQKAGGPDWADTKNVMEDLKLIFPKTGMGGISYPAFNRALAIAALKYLIQKKSPADTWAYWRLLVEHLAPQTHLTQAQLGAMFRQGIRQFMVPALFKTRLPQQILAAEIRQEAEREADLNEKALVHFLEYGVWPKGDRLPTAAQKEKLFLGWLRADPAAIRQTFIQMAGKTNLAQRVTTYFSIKAVDELILVLTIPKETEWRQMLGELDQLAGQQPESGTFRIKPRELREYLLQALLRGGASFAPGELRRMGGDWVMGRGGDWVMGRGGDWVMGRGGDLEMGRGGDWVMGRGGDLEMGREEDLVTGREGDLETGREEGLEMGREEDLVTGREGDLETGRGGDLEMGREGDLEMGREGDLEMGREGDLEMGREGDWQPAELQTKKLPPPDPVQALKHLFSQWSRDAGKTLPQLLAEIEPLVGKKNYSGDFRSLVSAVKAWLAPEEIEDIAAHLAAERAGSERLKPQAAARQKAVESLIFYFETQQSPWWDPGFHPEKRLMDLLVKYPGSLSKELAEPLSRPGVLSSRLPKLSDATRQRLLEVATGDYAGYLSAFFEALETLYSSRDIRKKTTWWLTWEKAFSSFLINKSLTAKTLTVALSDTIAREEKLDQLQVYRKLKIPVDQWVQKRDIRFYRLSEILEACLTESQKAGDRVDKMPSSPETAADGPVYAQEPIPAGEKDLPSGPTPTEKAVESEKTTVGPTAGSEIQPYAASVKERLAALQYFLLNGSLKPPYARFKKQELEQSQVQLMEAHPRIYTEFIRRILVREPVAARLVQVFSPRLIRRIAHLLVGAQLPRVFESWKIILESKGLPPGDYPPEYFEQLLHYAGLAPSFDPAIWLEHLADYLAKKEGMPTTAWMDQLQKQLPGETDPVFRKNLTAALARIREQPPKRTPEAPTRRKPRPTEPILEDALYIHNAGLVLIAPFLPRYFDTLEMVKNQAFVSEETAIRAVHLLQYLASGLTETEEQLLVFNKILCGLALETPIPLSIELTDKEMEISGQLLHSVLQNWEKMKNSPVENLRGTFFIREGRLLETEHSWQLKVESKTFDILLEFLPWTYSMVKLPWMHKRIDVAWKTNH